MTTEPAATEPKSECMNCMRPPLRVVVHDRWRPVAFER
jgi:hypothetical protein